VDRSTPSAPDWTPIDKESPIDRKWSLAAPCGHADALRADTTTVAAATSIGIDHVRNPSTVFLHVALLIERNEPSLPSFAVAASANGVDPTARYGPVNHLTGSLRSDVVQIGRPRPT
jgi:hypothetical protein